MKIVSNRYALKFCDFKAEMNIVAFCFFSQRQSKSRPVKWVRKFSRKIKNRCVTETERNRTTSRLPRLSAREFYCALCLLVSSRLKIIETRSSVLCVIAWRDRSWLRQSRWRARHPHRPSGSLWSRPRSANGKNNLFRWYCLPAFCDGTSLCVVFIPVPLTPLAFLVLSPKEC